MASEAGGEAEAWRGPSLPEAIPLLLGGPDRESSVPDLVLPEAREMSGPSWVLLGASRVSSEVLGAVRS